MLIKLPFTIENEVEGGTKSGDMWVDPGEVAFISRGFDRVHVGMKGGQMLHSAIPKLKTAVIEGTPDGIKLDEWTEKTVELVNSNTGNFMLKN